MVVIGTDRAGRADELVPPEPSAPSPSAEQLRALEQRIDKLEHPLPAAKPPELLPPLDVREPPFGELDSSWRNGNNPQPSSLLQGGTVKMSLYADTANN